MKKKGFTIIELIVVMAVIAILVLLATLLFKGYLQEARVTNIINDTRLAENKSDEYMIKFDKYPKGEKFEKTELETKINENKVYTYKGLFKGAVGGENLLKLDSEFIKKSLRTKLKGEFILNEATGGVYYIDNKSGSLKEEEVVSNEKDYEVLFIDWGNIQKTKMEVEYEDGTNKEHGLLPNAITNEEKESLILNQKIKITVIEDKDIKKVVILDNEDEETPENPSEEGDPNMNLYFTYEIIGEEITITGLTEEGKNHFNGDLIIPSTIENLPVTSIGDFAFESNNLTSVTIPNSVTNIGYGAFAFNQLTSLTLGNSVETIGEWAFTLNQLTSVVIPDSVTNIGIKAFADNQLTSLTLGNSVEIIGERAFFKNQLTSVTIPDSVINIGAWAFSHNQLTSVTIGNGVTNIGNGAFAYNQLTSVVIPNSVTNIGMKAFESNNLTSLTLGNSVTNIGFNAFEHNQLTSVTIPNSVKTIGEWAFNNNQLTSLTLGNSVRGIGEYAFYNNRLESVVIPDSVTNMGHRAFDMNGPNKFSNSIPTDDFIGTWILDDWNYWVKQ